MKRTEEKYMDLIGQWIEETTTWRKKMFPQTQVGTQEHKRLIKAVDEILDFVVNKNLTNQSALYLLACALGAALFNYRREVKNE